MEAKQVFLGRRWRRITNNLFLWGVVTMLAGITTLHYFTPQDRLLPLPVNMLLDRHVVERVLLLLPVAVSSLKLGTKAGLITLVLASLIMLPRALWISPHRVDALIESVATAAVGSFIIWVIGSQEREKALRQKAVLHLEAVDAVNAILTESLELEHILMRALEKVLEVTDLQAGLIYFLETQSQELVLAAHRGVSEISAAELDRLKVGEGFCGRVAQSGELMMVDDSAHDPRLTRPAVQREGLRSQVITPLKSKGGIQGVLAISTRELRQFLPQDLDTIQAIGNQIGLAIENARLYENLRFYLHEITRAQENERKRIARELHDETIQVLIALSRRLELLTTMSDQLPAPALQPLKSSQELIGNTLREMRRFIQDLRPPSLDHLGLVAALEGLVSDLDQNGIKAELAVIGLERRLVPEDTELMLFRIAQEALSNVRRHSGASKVNLQVEFSSDQLRMQITDNGYGFNAPERMSDLVSSGRLGLIGMHERARTLGGVLTIRSKPDHGTTVMVEVGLGERIHPF